MTDNNKSNKEQNNMNMDSIKVRKQPLKIDGHIHLEQQNESKRKHVVDGRQVQSNFNHHFNSTDYDHKSNSKSANNHSHAHNSEEGHGHNQYDEDGQIHSRNHHSDGDYNHNQDRHHDHTHSHQNTKAVLNRLSRAIGHLESIKRMVENGRDCSEVLIQLSAVKAAINNTGKVILQDHIQNCIVDAVESGDDSVINELNRAIDQFIK